MLGMALAITSLGWHSPVIGDELLVPAVEVFDGPIGVVVPEPGFGVHVSAYGELGSAEFDVYTDLAGLVHLGDIGPDTGASMPAATFSSLDPPAPGFSEDDGLLSIAAPDACDDKAHNNSIFKWFDTYRWYYRSGSTPSEMDAGEAAYEFYDAVSEVVGSTSCGMNDEVSASHSYGGYVSNPDDMHVTGGRILCDGREDTDGVSVVGFGNLPVESEGGAKNYLAYTCTWRTQQNVPYLPAAYESDIRLNKEDFYWGSAPFSSACTNTFSVQGVATHEFGHTFNLEHVSELDHGKLTVSAAVNGPCKEPEASFGKGDVLGMRYNY